MTSDNDNERRALADNEYCVIAADKKMMNILAMTFRLHAPWVNSLKEKRMIVKSLVPKLQNRFHVSAAEVDEQDTHHTLVT